MKKATNEQLLESYTKLGNVWKVADEFGMCGQSVWERLKKLGIEDKDKWTTSQLKILIDAYSQGQTEPVNIDSIAQEIGKLKSNISRKARELGLTSRFRKKTPEYCKQLSERVNKRYQDTGHPLSRRQIKICVRCGKFFEASRKQQFCSKRCGHNHSQSQGNQGYSKSGKRADLNNQYFRSRWEANYARYLNFLIRNDNEIIKWEFEKETFEFKKIRKGTRFYTPDFKVYFQDGHLEYHEVKGWDYPKGKTARKRFEKYYPKLKLILIDELFFKAIKKQGMDVVLDWE